MPGLQPPCPREKGATLPLPDTMVLEWLIGPRPWTWKRIRRRCRGGCLACQYALVGAPIATWVLAKKYQEAGGTPRQAMPAPRSAAAAGAADRA